MAAAAAAKVVQRCNMAKETGILDLSDCELTQVPHALYLLLLQTPPIICNFSHNVIKKLPPKLCENFSQVTDLDFSGNKLKDLPDQLENISNLTSLNLSMNSLEMLPNVVFTLEKLEILSLNGNEIKELDTEQIKDMKSLKEIHLKHNPLDSNTKIKLENIKGVKILM